MIASRISMRSVASSSSRPALACRAAAPAAVGRPSRRTAVSVSAAKLDVGMSMKDFPDYYRQLKKSDGGSLTLSSFQGKAPVVLFFYPKQGTPGCTKEACAFRDEYQRFKSAGVQVFGISSDSPEDNAKFAKENNLQFPLLTDDSSILRKTFGIPGDFLGLLPGRQTYVIDKTGKVILSFNDQLGAEKHVGEALKALGK